LKKRNKHVLWPIYFDSKKTRSEGRKIPKRLSIRDPTVDLIQKALYKLNITFKIDSNKAYPRTPWKKTGQILIERVKPKNKLLKKIAKELSI
jgi:signal recognition particle subunit SRP19